MCSLSPQNLHSIGRLSRKHGSSGALVLRLTLAAAPTAGQCLFLCLDGCYVPFFVDECRQQRATDTGTDYVVRLSDVDDAAAAARLVGATVAREEQEEDVAAAAAAEAAPAPSSKALRWQRVVGYTIADSTSQQQTAPIVRLDTATANPLFVLADGTLIPIVAAWLVAVDSEQHILHMSLPEGLLTL